MKSAIYSFLHAKKHGGEFLLRIEDTDSKRFDAGAESYLIDALNWLGITPDHGPGFGDGRYGPYRQSERDYRAYIDSLIANGNAYFAFDTPEELAAVRKRMEASGKPFSYDRLMRPYMRNSESLGADETKVLLNSGAERVVRFKVPKDVDVRFTDLVRGTVAFNTSTVDDKVLVKANGIPTYHAASTFDDHDMGITHVFRGEEWLSSTPLHLLLYDAMGWKAPEFAHLPLLLDSSGNKMSKRNAIIKDEPIFPFTVEVKDEDGVLLGTSVGLKERGYSHESLFNYLALLGWTPKNGKELMTREEMIEAFDIADVNNSGARFDPLKAAHFNRIYLEATPGKDLVQYLPENIFGYSEAQLEMIAKAAMERASFTKDIAGVISYFFEDVDLPVTSMKKPEEFPVFLDAVIELASAARIWDTEALVEGFYVIISDLSIHRGSALNNLRLCLTGGASGPKINEMMAMMGQDEFLRRMKKARAAIA